MDAVLLHLLSHCAKAADRIKRHNERLKAEREARGGAAPAPEAVLKDQGFTRAKVGGVGWGGRRMDWACALACKRGGSRQGHKQWPPLPQ